MHFFAAVYININLIILFADGRKPGRFSLSVVGSEVVNKTRSLQNDSGKWSSSSALLDGPARISSRFLPLISSKGSFLKYSHPLCRPIVCFCFLLMVVDRTDNSYTFLKRSLNFIGNVPVSPRVYRRENSHSHSLSLSVCVFFLLLHTNKHTHVRAQITSDFLINMHSFELTRFLKKDLCTG